MIESAPTKKVTLSGTEMYYENGVLSRHDGPAVIYPGGDEEWWAKGMLHRHDPSTPDILLPAICRWGIMYFEYWIKGIFICSNPETDGSIIVEWEGWLKDGEDSTAHQTKFDIIRPEPKYKSLYPPKRFRRNDSKKIQGGQAYGRITHREGDEESWT
jgi:hypothetical protein